MQYDYKYGNTKNVGCASSAFFRGGKMLFFILMLSACWLFVMSVIAHKNKK